MAKKKTANTGKPPKSSEGDATTPPASVAKLVDRFDQHADAYRAGKYNETQIRREFIDPLFKALGWDVDNSQGYAEAYKDVIHEDAIKIGGATKAPDYCFRIGGTRKFFVEAKKPSVDIKGDPGPAYQLRRYAWSAKLPLSILTDFEEFAVYDCRIKPSPNDKSSKARTIYFRYDDLIQRWNELASIFSRDAILKGSFDKYAESTKKKRGTAEVDDAFLAEIEQWRDVLARNIALRNKKLSQRELNFAVQRTIDRIVFLRICEDRGIEQYGTLLGLVNGKEIYQRLFERFRRADERYNSGLFHFSKEKSRPEAPDDLTPNLSIDDKPLKDILKRLYYPDSPYEFSVLPADILGQVYEQFLGKVIELSAGHRATVVEKPEVRKAGGVYYTPTYIVDYIVQNTVGRLVEGKSPMEVGALTPTYQPSKAKDARPLTVLDPACGSGSFLLGAYQFLLDWYRDQYADEGPDKHTEGKNPRLFQHSSGEYRLTTAERKRILLSHIYGVDIDTQAVEVTKLSLLLKVLEGESTETIGANLLLFHERALPDLADNIKCGNSLIGPDFYDNTQMDLFDEEERLRVNVFDWKSEFERIMTCGGFDAVIGNPPYLKEANNKDAFALIRKSSTRRYCVGKMDLWYAFACVAIDLLQDGGIHSFIATNTWSTSEGARVLRSRIMDDCRILSYFDFADFKVFSAAAIQTMIYVLRKKGSDRPYNCDFVRLPRQWSDNSAIQDVIHGSHTTIRWGTALIDPKVAKHSFAPVSNSVAQCLSSLAAAPARYLTRDEVASGIDVLQDFVTSSHLSKLPRNTANKGDGVFVLAKEEMQSRARTNRERTVMKPYYTTGELNRYDVNPCNRFWIIYANKDFRESIDDYPNLKNHLEKFAPIMTSVYRPFGLHRSREETLFRGPAIFSIRKTRRPKFALFRSSCYVSRAFMILQPQDWIESLEYLTGILNSRAIWFWLQKRGKRQGDQLQIDASPLRSIPVRTIDFRKSDEVAKHNRMEILVKDILGLHKQLQSATGHAATSIQRQIEATDRKIDQLVYDLYNLTAEEIAIVEAATQ